MRRFHSANPDLRASRGGRKRSRPSADLFKPASRAWFSSKNWIDGALLPGIR